MAKNYVNTGTASVTNGDTTVTFDGVSLDLFKVGDQFMQGGASGIIASLDIDAGTAELVDDWGGVTSTAAPYAVMTIPVGAELATSTRTIQAALTGLVLGTFVALSPAAGDTISWADDGTGWAATSLTAALGPINATDNPISNITTAMFAANVVDTDSTFAANSDSRLATQAAIKSYVTNAVAVAVTGLTWKAAVQLRTTGNVTLSGEQTIDGVLTSGSRVLVMAQTTASQNGIYVTGSGTWTRATDADTGAEIVAATVKVTSGTLYADTAWYCTNDAITLGSTSVVFQQVPMAVYTAGTGLTLTGTQFSINAAQALTSLTLGGATLGSNALAVTGSVAVSGNLVSGFSTANTNSSLVQEAMRSANAGTGYAFNTFYNSGSRSSYYGHGGGTADFYIQTTAGNIYLAPSGVVQTTVCTDGSFLVGTNTAGGWTGSGKMNAQAAGGTALTVYQSSGSANAVSIRGDAASVNPMLFYYSTGLAGSVTYTGGGTGVAFNTSSDVRLKDKLESQRDFGAIIDALWFGDVAFKADKTRTPHMLCIAQEAAAHFADAIHAPTDPDAMWSADYSKFSPLAMWGVKDLRARVAPIEARLSVVEAKLGIAA